MKLLCFLGLHNWSYNKIAGFSKMTGQFHDFTDQRKCRSCARHEWTIYPVILGGWKEVTEEIDNSVFTEDMGLIEVWS